MKIIEKTKIEKIIIIYKKKEINEVENWLLNNNYAPTKVNSARRVTLALYNIKGNIKKLDFRKTLEYVPGYYEVYAERPTEIKYKKKDNKKN
jgi:hypothetical protein